MALSSFLIPITSAFTGWFTTWIAIKMLFYPREPLRIFGLTIQGIFPKNKAKIAEKLGSVVSSELISFDDIRAKLIRPETVAMAMPHINERLDVFIRTKLSEKMPFLSLLVGDNTINTIKESISEELSASLPEMLDKMSVQMKSELDINKIVTEKVNQFSSEKLEQILLSVMQKEFMFIEIVGGIFGLLIGFIQLLFT
jgi:uncharacterized membrane protein YheB (UPF0754 family)